MKKYKIYFYFIGDRSININYESDLNLEGVMEQIEGCTKWFRIKECFSIQMKNVTHFEVEEVKESDSKSFNPRNPW